MTILPIDHWMISVDDHVIEPRDLWKDRLPAKYKDRGPQWVSFDTGGEGWLFEGTRGGVPAMNVNGAIVPEADRLPGDIGMPWSAVPAAAYEPGARVQAMNANQVIAAIMFPNYPGFTGNLFWLAQDRDVGLACLKAYNDWILDEWCAPFPGRFIGNMLLPLWDPELCAAEVERTALKGARTVAFPGLVHNLGLPPITEVAHWDPFFSAVNSTGIVLNSHGGNAPTAGRAGRHRIREFADVTSLDAIRGSMEDPLDAHGPKLAKVLKNPETAEAKPDYQAEHLREWLTGGVFERYPNVKLIFSEIKIGWVPGVIAAMPDPEAAKATYREHMYAAWIPAPENGFGVQEFADRETLEGIGIGSVVCETDFPHAPTPWPNSIDLALGAFAKAGLNEDERHKLLRGTSERLLNFTPATEVA